MPLTEAVNPHHSRGGKMARMKSDALLSKHWARGLIDEAALIAR